MLVEPLGRYCEKHRGCEVGARDGLEQEQWDLQLPRQYRFRYLCLSIAFYTIGMYADHHLKVYTAAGQHFTSRPL